MTGILTLQRATTSHGLSCHQRGGVAGQGEVSIRLKLALGSETSHIIANVLHAVLPASKHYCLNVKL